MTGGEAGAPLCPQADPVQRLEGRRVGERYPRISSRQQQEGET